jgi:stage V sporulation protein D (sporulation-specific penicillin-binding protein)
MTAALACRLIYLQAFQHESLSEMAKRQRTRTVPVAAMRGTIYDRGGEVLAKSVAAASVYAVPAEVADKEQAANILAEILGEEPNKILARLQRRQSLVWLARRVDEKTEEKLRHVSIDGIGLTAESEREYPQGVAAAHVLGFTGFDNQGLDGLELVYDEILRGEAGCIAVEYDAGGRELPKARHEYIEPKKGKDIYLTIDLAMQRVLEKELDQIMAECGAKGVYGVMMQPQTGEILAMANRPAFNPNEFGKYAPELWRNKAVADAFEPGSTFKILTLAAALDSKTAGRGEHFFDSGFVEVQGHYVHCWKKGGHGSQSFDEMVWNSCNPAFVMLGLRMGSDVFYDYLQRFGLGSRTGISLVGEASGILYKKSRVQPLNLATMAMGQSIAVTPVQLAAAVSAAINGGSYFKPQIVRAFGEGEDAQIVASEKMRQAVSEQTSREVREILTGVVENGSGKNAAVDGYAVGGKTGTAQKAGEGGYMSGKYIASFIGFAPAENPEALLYIAIDEPQGMYYGGQVAAPRFKNIMQVLLPYLEERKKNRQS